MKVSVDGKTYEYDVTKLLFSEAAFIQKKTGMKFMEWQEGLGAMDSLAVGALVYVLRKRAGEQPDWDALDFNMLSVTWVDEDDDETEEPAPKEGGSAEPGTETS